MASPFNDLVAYRLALELAVDLRAAVERWPSLDRTTGGRQAIKAAASVAASISEASGRRARPDQRRFLDIARGSQYETEHWINFAQACDLLDGTWTDRIDDCARALSGLIRKWPQD